MHSKELKKINNLKVPQLTHKLEILFNKYIHNKDDYLELTSWTFVKRMIESNTHVSYAH